jgi:hypothetical protein
VNFQIPFWLVPVVFTIQPIERHLTALQARSKWTHTAVLTNIDTVALACFEQCQAVIRLFLSSAVFFVYAKPRVPREVSHPTSGTLA